ncbi:MAG: hypothetical protein J4F45_11740 [Pseudomonadales bacterium]|nr:hypothetical protein [Pseudomonadales bacterium]
MDRGASVRDAERIRALPLWGEAPLPADRVRADDADEHGFTDIMRILLRTWPWLKPLVVGSWRQRPLPISLNGGSGTNWGFAYAPILVTVLAALGTISGWLPVGVDWTLDLLVSWRPRAGS